MTLEAQLAEDRALRDSAFRLFKSDLAIVRADLKQRGVAARLADRVGDGAMDLLDEAVDYADDNRTTLAAIVAAVVLWFTRRPIIRGLTHLFEKEPEGVADRLKALNPFSRE